MRSTTLLLIAISTLAILPPPAARAQPAAQAASPPPEKFRLTRSTVNVPERGQITQLMLEAGSERLSFVPPPLCDARLVAPERKVVFDRQKGIGLFSVQLNPIQIVPFDGDAKPAREQVEARWPGSKVTEEFDQPTGLGQGRSFVLSSQIPQQGPWVTRVVVVTTRAGAVELSLSCPAADVARLRPAFVNLINTIKFEPPVVAAARQ